ncbi:drug resistance transporter, EmrB/QacA subfamily [Actinopolyspora mzabensis]|uniref:MFS-type drug efflux transporter P55 n=1 Tax=Actinopolyspora mzabensis TaxID=995066 RepID=A0A1G8ZAJ2_ACTMZ|nr:MDR family MFS transporter [Actinopolyspora mzabensis]SDK12079.1 drug resistance transporter, EmrB/QacA subfamily [Actinopolyspora mzabensis]
MRATSTGDGQEALPAPPRGAVAAFSGMMVVVFLAGIDSTVVATVLPSILADLGGASLLTWVVTSYLLTTAVSVPLWGKAADLTGKRRLYVLATTVFLVGSVAVAVAPNMPVMLTARALQGIGTGGLMALTPTIVGELFPVEIRGRFHGRQGAILAGANIVGPLVGGVFTATLGWRAAFWINLPLALPALVLVMRHLSSVAPVQRSRRLDLVGATLLAAASAALLLALSQDSALASGSSRIVLLIIAGTAVMAYLPWQNRHSDPILPLRVLRSPTIAGAITLSFLAGATMLTVVTYAPMYAQTVQNQSAAMSGAQLLPLTAAVLVSNLLGGSLITWFGRYRPFILLGTLATTAGSVLLATLDINTPAAVFTAALILMGVGMGLTMQPAVLVLQNAVGKSDLGSATAASTFFRQIGSTLAIGILGGLLTARTGPQLSELAHGMESGAAATAARTEIASAFGDIFLMLTPVMAIGVIVALILPEKPLSSSAPAEQEPKAEPESKTTTSS